MKKTNKKEFFFTILGILTEFEIPCPAICQTEGTHFQSFGQMTGNFRHLAKWLAVRGIWPNDWFDTLTVTYISHPRATKYEVQYQLTHLSAPEFTPNFSGFRVVLYFVFYVVFCESLFVLLSFFFWPLCCLSFFWPLCCQSFFWPLCCQSIFDLRLLSTLLTSSSFPYPFR